MNARLLVLFACAAALSGCVALSVTPVGVTGFAYSHIRTPLIATGSPERPNKVGRATMRSIFGWYAQGDASIEAAAENGGITHIHHVDVESTSVLGVITDVTTIVYGN